MNLKDRLIVKTEKMINNGNAIARFENFPVFIEGACPDETLEIEITKVNKSYAEGKILNIVEPSKCRITPKCPLHNVCGSCSWQYIEYGEQLKQKENIVKETIKNITGKDYSINTIAPSPITEEYRCKVQLPVAQTKVSKRILAGYYKKNSHELINIKYCFMHSKEINEVTAFIREKAAELNISGYNEKTLTGLLRHIIYRKSSYSGEVLIVFVINSDTIPPELTKLSKMITEQFAFVKSISANFNTKKTNVITGSRTENITGEGCIYEVLDEKKYKISAGSFFQVNPLCAKEIFNIVKELIKSKIKAPSVLDAYSGVSSFGIWLSEIASKVVCIEEVKSASEDAKENVKINSAQNVEIINGDAAVEFNKLIKQRIKFDVSVIDPPRKGCSKEAIDYLTHLTDKYIIYVSCNVSTLARDMNILSSYGWEADFIKPIDMFPNTSHVETIVMFNLVSQPSACSSQP